MWGRGLLVVLVLGAAVGAAELTVVGVLGNSAGLEGPPLPYAYYTGIAADGQGRLYLAGAAAGVPVCDPAGPCLAVVPLPESNGLIANSLMTRAGDSVFLVAQDAGGQRSALYRIVTQASDAAALKAARLFEGHGAWALSPTLTPDGRLLLGQSKVQEKQYTVVTVQPATGEATTVFTLPLPAGAQRPWRHIVQVDADGLLSIGHHGGVDWSGRFSLTGERQGEARQGLIVHGFRYVFGYAGQVRRFDLAGDKAMPGDCGADAPEIRMPTQLVLLKGLYYFAGRGGAVEAQWNGTNFVYTRRIGGCRIVDLADAGDHLEAAAFTSNGNNDVQHRLLLPKAQPAGQLLNVATAFYGLEVQAVATAPHGLLVVARHDKRQLVLFYDGPEHLRLEQPLAELKSAGQIAVLGNELLLADPDAGTVWRRPLMEKEAVPLKPWRAEFAGVTGLAAAPDGSAVYAATAKQVQRLAPDGRTVVWTAADAYQGVRRLAATREFLYVCDAAARVVDQLDAATGKRLARLEGQPLVAPQALAADVNGVYVSDPGAGCVFVATGTLWRPDLGRQPPPRIGAPVAVTLPAKPPPGDRAAHTGTGVGQPLSQPGRLSVNVYDENNVTVRQLACAQASDQPVTWDGRDMYGRWCAPGSYRFHGVIAPKLSLRYVTSLGQSGNPPYNTPDGKGSWGGVWGYVMDICAVEATPDSDIVVLWAFEEGEGGLIRMSQDGAVRWKQHLDWWFKANQMAVCSDGKSVYIAGASAMGAPAGQSNYGGDQRRPLLWRVDAATGRKQLYAPAQTPQPMFGDYHAESARIVTDLAAHGGKLYLTAPADGAVYVIDPATGKGVDSWRLETVSGIAFTAGGQIYAGTGSKVVELGADGKVLRPVADLGGEVWDVEPAADGAVAVTVGTPRHQVVLVSPKGRELRTIGSKGGRPLCGRMEPKAFRDPGGLCVTGVGRLFVAESAAPKRFTRWSAEGKLEREFHGPYYYSGMFGIDEAEPEFVYGDTHGDLIRYRLNYDTGAWSVDHYWINAYKDSGIPIKWWPRIRRHGGRVWWCSGSGAIVELLDDRVRAVAAVYGGWVERQADGTYVPQYHKKNTGLMGTWSDLNGDGRQQADEWQVTDKPVYPLKGAGPQQGWGAYFDEQFNLFMHDWSDGEAGGVWEIPVSEWKNGVPVYRWDQARHAGLPRSGVADLAHGSPGARTAFAAGDATYAFNGGYNAAGLPGVGHGHDWEFAQVTKYDRATGKPLWHAGERAAAFVAPGQHYCPTGPGGIVNDYLFWTDENSLVHVWDVQHGLYVDTLLEDISRGPVPTPYTVWVELFNTRVFRHPRNGKVYLLAASDAIHVYEVLGTEQAPVRFEGRFELTAAGLDSARQAAAAATAATGRRLTIPRAAAPPPLPGDTAAAFAAGAKVAMPLSATAGATVRLLADSDNLYVRFEVTDDSPWKNAGGDVTALFKSGDEVSVWLGPSAGRREPGVGDRRFLFAPDEKGDGVRVVVYQPKVAAGAAPVSFRSPSGEVRMDRVAATTAAPAKVSVTAQGYVLTAAIPWRESGVDPKADAFGLDLSVNFSDPAGQRNVARLHWGRNGGAIVYDLPSEARLEPATWGQARLAPAP